MNFLHDSFRNAVLLILSLDGEVYSAVWTSITVSISSAFCASAMGIPLGLFIATSEFPLKGLR